MIYLSGATNDRDEPALIEDGIGLMIQRGNSYHLRCQRYPWHAIDIGMAASDADPYLDYLAQRSTERCLFAVSPDAYPDAVESQRRGLEYAPIIRDLGFPVAVVAQDGAENLSWPWDEFDCLFIGGKRTPNPHDEWKTSAAAERLVHAARNAGKWVHMGRVNSGDGVGSRMERARAMGCLSADGTFAKYRRRQRATDRPGDRDKRGASEIGRWLMWLDTNPTLPGFTTSEAPSHPTHRAALLAVDTRQKQPSHSQQGSTP